MTTLLEGLKKILTLETPESTEIRQELEKKYGFSEDDKETLLGALIDHLQELESLVNKSGNTIGWGFRFDNPATLVEYYEIAYQRLTNTVVSIASQYGYAKEDIEAAVYWIPSHFDEVAVIDDTLGEWHFTVSYKDVLLFGIVFTPLEDSVVANISEDVEESFNVSAFGMEANPYIFLESYEELIGFLNLYFEHADIRNYRVDEQTL